MAKATAICTCRKCGKTFEKYATKYNRAEADRWVEWIERTITICPDCEREERMKQAAELNAQAAEAGMPALEGSPKQIAWAEDIRAKFFGQTGKLADSYRKRENMQHEADMLEATRAYILKHMDSAKWWIEHRTYFEGVIKEVYANNQAVIDGLIACERSSSC